jgi:hypothetical protein
LTLEILNPAHHDLFLSENMAILIRNKIVAIIEAPFVLSNDDPLL